MSKPNPQDNSQVSLREKAIYFFQKNKRKSYFKVIITVLLLLFIITYNIVFTPSVFEKILKSQFDKNTNGKINLHVTKSSLLRGFSIENIEILSGEDFDRKPLFKVDKINIFFSVFGFFAGDFGLHEAGIYNPRVYLYHKDNIWNSGTLMKAKGKMEEPPETVEKSGKSKGYISLPFKIRGFFKFILNDFQLTITDLNPGGSDTFEAGLKNFTLHTYIITHKFKKIPFNLAAFDIFKSIVVHLDPEKTIDIYYKNSNSRLKSPMDLHWLLTFDKKLKKEGFFSRLEIGHHDIPVEYKGKHLLPLNFGIDYDIKYNPSNDKLDFDFFRLSFSKDIWMNVAGSINSLSKTEKMHIDLNLNKSNINLDKLYPYYKALTADDDLTFRGDISLAPLKITGPLDKLVLDGKINLYKIIVNMKDKNFNIGYFDLFYKSEIDKNLTAGIIPKVRNLNLNWNGSLNNSKLGAQIIYSLKEKINIYTFVHNLNVEPFSGDQVSGIFDLDFRLNGPDEKNLNASIDLKSNGFTYYMGRGISGLNKLNMKVVADVLFPGEGFSNLKVNLSNFSFFLNNEKNKKGMSLLAAADLDRSLENMTVNLDLKNFTANLNNLKIMLPGSLREKIENYAEESEKDIRLNGKTSIYAKNDMSFAQTTNNTNIFIDDLDINDIVFNTKVIKESNVIQIPLMTLNGLNDSLAANVNGKLSNESRKTEYRINNQTQTKYEKVLVPDIQYYFKLGKKDKTRIFKSFSIAGILDFAGYAKDNIINGKLKIDKMYLDNGNFTRVNNINVDFPFEHDMRFKKTLNLTAANKERIIKSFDEDFKYNFTIDSVEIPNPAKIKEPMQIVYPGGSYAGLSSAMRYKDNVFEMPMMQIFLLNGLVTVQDTVFNVGTGNTEEMEYRTFMQIKDIDFKQLIPAEKASSIKDGKISADAMFTASSIKNMWANTSGYVSIYKIGRQFARQGVKIVMPESSPFVSFVVDEWTIIHKFDIELKEGLAYANILYSKGTLGNLIGLEGNKIVQERSPIAEIWRKTGEEVKIYQSDSLPASAYGTQ
jgi:hypothetical protein